MLAHAYTHTRTRTRTGTHKSNAYTASFKRHSSPAHSSHLRRPAAPSPQLHPSPPPLHPKSGPPHTHTDPGPPPSAAFPLLHTPLPSTPSHSPPQAHSHCCRACWCRGQQQRQKRAPPGHAALQCSLRLCKLRWQCVPCWRPGCVEPWASRPAAGVAAVGGVPVHARGGAQGK